MFNTNIYIFRTYNCPVAEAKPLHKIGISKFGSYQPILSLTKDSFKEMQLLFLLKIIADNPEGITAYQMTTNYHFPRSNALRLLEGLSRENRIQSEEKIVEGRTNKIFTLTNAGFIYLLSLKEKWTDRFVMMEELTTGNITSSEKKFFVDQIKQIKTKPERLEYINSIKRKIAKKIAVAEKKVATLTKIQSSIDLIIHQLDDSENLSKSEISEIFEIFNQREEEQ